jgi:multidrug efflux system membrane fusion protein
MIHQREVEILPPLSERGLPPQRPRRHRWVGFLWLVAFAAAGYAGYRYYQTSQQKKQAAEAALAARMADRPVSVAATAARRGDVPIYLRGIGNVQAFNTVNVKTRVDGPLVSVNYTEGQYVKAGEVLVEIDPRPFQVAVEQAEGQLARDQAQLNNAKVDLARYQELWKDQVIAKQQLDTQAAAVGQFAGAIEADKAAVDNAKLNLSFTRVTAPISGRIGLRLVDIGNIVHASDANPLAIITQLQPIAVVFTIPADSLPPVLQKLHEGVKLPVDAYDASDTNKIASGTLLTVDNQIDPNTGTSRLKAIFDNNDGVLFPNQFVNCHMLLEVKRGVVLVPAPAIQRGPQGPYVYVVQPNGTAKLRNVALGVTEGSETEITSGLAPGETVITDGQDKLQDGSKVTVQRTAAAPSAASQPAPQPQPTGPFQGRTAAGQGAGIPRTVTGTGNPAGPAAYTGNAPGAGTNTRSPNFTASPGVGGPRSMPQGASGQGRGRPRR